MSNIIKFNNALFTIFPAQVDEVFAGDPVQVSFRKSILKLFRLILVKRHGGYVRLEFIDDQEEGNGRIRFLKCFPGSLNHCRIKVIMLLISELL